MASRPDVIVVGAGAAGLCCAGELVLHGKRPLLISETKEVAHAFRSVFFGENRGTVQALAWQAGVNGGWWAPLARKLGVSFTFRHYLPMESTIIGSEQYTAIPLFGSADAFVDAIAAGVPGAFAPDVLPGIKSAVAAGMALDPEEMFTMDRVRLQTWLCDHGADEQAAAIVTGFLGRTFALEPEESVEHLSVPSGLGVLRVMFTGEGFLAEIFPDSRDGVWIPMARAIEERGAEIWRGRKVERVLVEGGRAVGVLLIDGTEVRADHVAMATSNVRMARFFDEIPSELAEALAYPAPHPPRQVGFYMLLDHPVHTRNTVIALNDHDGRTLTYCVPQHETNVEPGKQVLGVSFNNPGDRTTEELLTEAHEVLGRAFPAFKSSSVLDVATLTYTPEHWMDYTTVGPKVPRKSPSVEGLWYVGEGASPVVGVWTEAAAGAGVLGAREIAAFVR